MSKVKQHLSLLGLKVRDRVTGLGGIVTSVGFDMYGCIQAIVHPGNDKDGKPRDQLWFDVNRLEVLSPTPVMQRPDFDQGPQAEGLQGPAEKPASFKS